MRAMKSSKILLFYSPQGGTGKTTLAFNTAILYSSFGLKVLLVDMSVYGSIASVKRIPLKGGIGLTAILTMLDLDCDNLQKEKIDDVVKNSIVNGGLNKNLDVLLSANPIKMEAIKEIHCKALLESVRKLDYDLIIVDTSSELSEKNMLLFENADFCVIPVIQDLSCGWKMVMFREVMDKCRISSSKFGLVVNMCSKYSGFNNQEFEKEIGYKILMEIPYFRKNYQNHINKGQFISNTKNKKAIRYFSNTAKIIMNSMKNGSGEKGI